MGRLVVDKVCSDENVHDGMVTSVSYHNGYLYSAANDGKIKIFDSDLNFIRDVSVHEAFVYAIVVDQNGKLYTSSSDGTIKCVKEPLVSDDHSVILEHENQGESLYVDENDVLYVGDNTGNVSAYENGHLKYTITVPDAVKCVFVEKEILYIFTPTELSIYEVTDVGKNVKKFNIPAKPPITLFGEKVNGRYKYAALLAPSGQEIIVLKNSVEDNFETLTINDEFHELTITAIEGADEYLFSADYTGKVVLSQVEGNELKEFVNGSTGSGCCNCLAPMDDKNVFVGCTGGEIMKVAFNSGDKRQEGDVTSITFHDGRLYSAGGDGKIKIWDVNLNFIRDVIIHEAYIYAIAVDKVGKLYSSSCDGSIKCVKKPLESDDHDVILQHENEIEAVFVDDKLWFYCGDDKGGVTAFEDGKLKFTLNIVECVKSLYVENNLYYTLLNHDLSIHEVRGENGKFVMKGSIPGKFPVTLFGEKTAGRSKYFAILTRDGKGITIAKNGVDEKFEKLAVKENLHEMIVNAMVGFGEFLFSADYAGKVVRSKVEGNQLTTLESFNTGSGCANCLAIIDDKTIFVGSTDGSIKKIHYN